MTGRLRPGDVLTVRSNGWAAWLIRLGAALRDKPNLNNHVAVMHHYDSAGVPWGYEGRPGGVGSVDLRKYLASRWTLINSEQEKTPAQRELVCGVVQQADGTEYDWQGIAADAVEALGIKALFAQDWHGQGAPVHVVCSSLADWAYREAGLANPNGDDKTRRTTPGDWSEFILTQGWL